MTQLGLAGRAISRIRYLLARLVGQDIGLEVSEAALVRPPTDGLAQSRTSMS